MSKTLHVYYRISDKGNPKVKLPSASKFSCFENAVREFGRERIFVIADNCTESTIAFIKDQGVPFVETSLGNSASFRHMLSLIKNERTPDEYVYLLEDDYIHLPGSRALLLEGLEIGDYATLYDHPDKYLLCSEGGNPINQKTLAPARIFITKGGHWRTINSTTMTFACKVATLIEDADVWEKHTAGRNPKDFNAFIELGAHGRSWFPFLAMLMNGKRKIALRLLRRFLSGRKRRVLLSALPARATHAELRWLSPVVDWSGKS